MTERNLNLPVRQRSRRRTGPWPIAVGLALASLLGLLGLGGLTSRAPGQISMPRARQLSIPEYYEDAVQARALTNQLRARLTMREADYLPGRIIFGRVNRLEQYNPEGRTNVIALAPECFFNQTNRLAWSTGRLDIVALDGKFMVTGREGFQLSLTNTVLIVSNHVRTVLQQNLLNP